MTNFKFTALYANRDKLTLSDTLSFDNIPREGLVGMQVTVNEKTELFTLHLEPEQKLIYRYRPVRTPGRKPEDESEPFVYLVGWRQKVGGKTIQSITYLVDWIGKGFTMHQAGKFRDDHPWFYPPNFHEHEVFEGEKYLKDNVWRTK
jgi:hypothetical protein